MATTADAELLEQEQPPARPGFLQTPLGRNFALGLAIAAVLAIMAGVWMWSQQPTYKVLFSNFSDRDGGAIVASLQQMNVPYKFAEGGGALLDGAQMKRMRTKEVVHPPVGQPGRDQLERQQNEKQSQER